MLLLQLFSTTDPVGTLLQVPEQVSAHLPQPAQPTPVFLPPTEEPAKTAQVKQGHVSMVSLLSRWRKQSQVEHSQCNKVDVLVEFETSLKFHFHIFNRIQIREFYKGHTGF